MEIFGSNISRICKELGRESGLPNENELFKREKVFKLFKRGKENNEAYAVMQIKICNTS